MSVLCVDGVCCCNVLRCLAACCNVMQRVAACCSVLQRVTGVGCCTDEQARISVSVCDVCVRVVC